ncbi:aminopeptidase P family protein [Desulfofundulus thermobenzoicus]|uniref:M24 family metallopeptidase n=1 Tax=Desulfofundulus thermobenzoicus TaxID=29376 RepID=UPI00311A9951
MPDRIDRLRAKLAGEKVDAFLVLRPENRFYLSGFTGTAGALLVTPREVFFLADFRYVEQARSQCTRCQVVMFKDSLHELLRENLPRWGVFRLGCEGDYLTYKQFATFREKLEGITLVPLYGIVENLRQAKEEAELDIISRAVSIADLAFSHIMGLLKPGITEWDVALELEFFMRRHGASKNAFETIVASGPRGAMPHGVASHRVIQPGDLVTMDFGCQYQGYHSDITRTVAVGRSPDAHQREIYNLVLSAQRAALAAVRAGVKACDVDRAAREVIEGAGYGDNFGHSTGHGVGLAVHEEPSVSKKNENPLEPGMVITIEPGVYISGWGGVRIEDMVVVEEGGCRVLTGAPKDTLLICPC